MKQASLANLKAIKQDLKERGLKPATCADLAGTIHFILELFDQAEEEHVLLAQCIDDLARHAGYQLEHEAEETANETL